MRTRSNSLVAVMVTASSPFSTHSESYLPRRPTGQPGRACVSEGGAMKEDMELGRG
jgi:hypothetical protein